MKYSFIIFLPLLGFLVAGLFSSFLKPRFLGVFTSGLVSLSALLSWVIFLGGGDREADVLKIVLCRFIDVTHLQALWSLRVDSLTMVMFVVVNTVSALVHIYSIGYMSKDPGQSRFFAYLSLFTFAMLILVASDNMLQMFFGWEGVGLASFLLISFWYKKPSANAAAMKAFLLNRVGDFGFMLGILGVYILFGSLDFDPVLKGAMEITGAHGEAGKSLSSLVIFSGWELEKTTALNLAALFLFMGAIGKSAQIPLHTWLPDAMEGPTPVSALIHAATMVTAGVFMLARLSPLFLHVSPVILIIGSLTAFFAATIALAQNDIKRVIAWSTCSQLGYMFAASGAGAYSVAMFHLFTHAFFKALLFLGAGSVIHAVSGEQDMRKMGGLMQRLPYTYMMMMIGTLALTGVGIPGTHLGFSGFFSKEAVIESVLALTHNGLIPRIALWLLITTTFLTGFYSWRLIFMTFHGKSRSEKGVMESLHEAPPVMLVPLVFLALGALFSGMIFYHDFIGAISADLWKGVFLQDHAVHAHPLSVAMKWMPFAAMLTGGLLAWFFHVHPVRFLKDYSDRSNFLSSGWHFDRLYDFLFVRPFQKTAWFFSEKGDKAVIDGFGVHGACGCVLGLSRRIVNLQSGYIYHYAFAMILGVTFLLIWMTLGDIFR